ncbi:hypothetical protein [Bartonella acomydis]|uniref:hypothetical protein n=1 Tax=Bartonella acomydis TaxID=686234 RepID=UPI0031F18EEC
MIATKIDGSSPLIQKLSGNGRVIFTSDSNDFKKASPYYSLLHVAQLSGSIHFSLKANFVESYGNYFIIEKGKGNHTLKITDFDTEITHSFF